MAAAMTAPELDVVRWFNSAPLTLAGLRGRVVVIGAFQMLCPGCVSESLPQLRRIHELFPADAVTAIALHSVFEHHAAMTPVSRAAFLHEYRIASPRTEESRVRTEGVRIDSSRVVA